MVQGQAPDAEAGQKPEGEVKACYQGICDQPAKPAFGNGELRDHPPGLTAGVGAQTFCESGDFLCGETVEKEVGDDQIEGFIARLPPSRIGMVNAYAVSMNACVQQKTLQHGVACIDGFDVELGIPLKQAPGKAAVSIAEHYRGPAVVKFIEKAATATPEGAPKCCHFHPAVDAGETAKMGRPIHRAKQRIGVSRTKSAAQRSASGVKRLRPRSSNASEIALREPAKNRAEVRG